MNQYAGATTQDIQRGICETGTKGGIEVSRETREQACVQAGIDPPIDYSGAIVGGAVALAILASIVAVSLFFGRTAKKPVKKPRKKA